MEAVNRKPFQGVLNIIRFNWHFYLIAFLVLALTFFLFNYLESPWRESGMILIALISLSILISLLVSFYVYDLSGLYHFAWFSKLNPATIKSILNVHAGFDESSTIIQNCFKGSKLMVCDFYDPEKHTEVSIKRARKAYGSFPGTISISTNKIPCENSSADLVFLILAAHEIRDENERTHFFKEVKRVLKPGAIAVVTEHQRDLINFLAYNIGFLHFQSRASWLRVFRSSGLRVDEEIKNTAFISTFILKND